MKMSKFFLLALSLLLISSSVSLSQKTVDQDQIDKIFKPWDKDNSPGVAVGIVEKGELIFAKGYGMSNLEHNIPIKPNSVFDIASVSKQFCGMAIGILIQEGKLTEEDDIRKYLPDFPEYGKPITVGNLLHHTSGIRDWPTLLLAAGFQFDDVISFDHLVNIIYNQKELSFETGSESVYSNSNYTLLVRILEVITGDGFDMWCRQNLFQPLDMNDTHFHLDHRRIVKNRVDSYTPIGGNLFMRNANNLCAVGSSSLYTTIEDLAKWVGNFKTGKVGGKNVIKMMTQASSLENGEPVNYGFGIGIGKWKGRDLWSHSGGWAGFRTILSYFPEEDFGIIVLSNLASVAPDQLAGRIADLYFLDEIETHEEEAEITEEAFDRFKECEFNPSRFEAYMGEFELVNAPGFIIEYTMADGKFYTQATGQQKFQIFPSSDTTFFLKVVEAWVSFHPESDGSVNRITLHQNGRYEARRVEGKTEAFNPSPDVLMEYIGKYSSKELSVVYNLIVNDGKLIINHERFGQLNLNTTKKDLFQTVGMPGELLFVRDQQDEIVEFRLSMGPRTRNILFNKL